ncbi:hypothetical protein ADUPG1_012112, partial [Aduncisulcus paluster]
MLSQQVICKIEKMLEELLVSLSPIVPLTKFTGIDAEKMHVFLCINTCAETLHILQRMARSHGEVKFSGAFDSLALRARAVTKNDSGPFTRSISNNSTIWAICRAAAFLLAHSNPLQRPALKLVISACHTWGSFLPSLPLDVKTKVLTNSEREHEYMEVLWRLWTIQEKDEQESHLQPVIPFDELLLPAPVANDSHPKVYDSLATGLIGLVEDKEIAIEHSASPTPSFKRLSSRGRVMKQFEEDMARIDEDWDMDSSSIFSLRLPPFPVISHCISMSSHPVSFCRSLLMFSSSASINEIASVGSRFEQSIKTIHRVYNLHEIPDTRSSMTLSSLESASSVSLWDFSTILLALTSVNDNTRRKATSVFRRCRLVASWFGDSVSSFSFSNEEEKTIVFTDPLENDMLALSSTIPLWAVCEDNHAYCNVIESGDKLSIVSPALRERRRQRQEGKKVSSK